MSEDKLTPEEERQLREYEKDKDSSSNWGVPLPEEKHNVHSFLNNVAESDDTTKTGNLTIDELGMPRINLRTYKDLALISKTFMDNPVLHEYYNAQAEILTSTSLSKDAKLISLAVMQKRQIEDVTKPKKENKGWFGSKDKPAEQGNIQ